LTVSAFDSHPPVYAACRAWNTRYSPRAMGSSLNLMFASPHAPLPGPAHAVIAAVSAEILTCESSFVKCRLRNKACGDPILLILFSPTDLLMHTKRNRLHIGMGCVGGSSFRYHYPEIVIDSDTSSHLCQVGRVGAPRNTGITVFGCLETGRSTRSPSGILLTG
jgi:hypothetical protein